MRRPILTCLTFGTVLVLATAVMGAPPGAPSVASGPEVVRVNPWFLYQGTGHELYDGLCASCHGAEGMGGGFRTHRHAAYAPPLNQLRRSGVSKDHWTYVVRSACDDPHHWRPGGAATMPCWQRVFRHATGNDAAPMLISAKLSDYLEEIQQ